MTNGNFTVRDGVAWLGLSWDDYLVIRKIGTFGLGGLSNALLDAREVSEGRLDLTPAEVLARNGVDLSRGVKAFCRQANRIANENAATPLEFGGDDE